MSSTEIFSTFTGPISTVAYKLAQQWSREQATPEKSLSVLLNTLSVSFVNFYLECMGFATDLEASDSWSPVQQTLMDVADLSIKNVGKIECRPVLENADFVYIPPEVQSNRIGYVVVQISESFHSAQILGFIKEVSVENLPISSLQPLENLLKYLESIEVKEITSNHHNFVNIKKWFENFYELGWSSIESIVLTQPAWQFRSASDELRNYVERAKLINFGIQQAHDTSVGVIIRVWCNEHNTNENDFDIVVELHPTYGQEYLPPMLHIMILDFEGTALLEAKAKNDNKKIELEFGASMGDTFSIKIALVDISIIENFVV
ncbi:MAG: DUF1822 family protein [Calothrix sp. C42_A2020_038]|nr:DUF1822 family protein [Calothrix sp. C42_A2020_038]